MLVRTQISLTAEQHATAMRLAAERGVSMSAIMREALDHLVRISERTGAQALLEWAERNQQPGAAQVAVDHDAHLGEGGW